MGVSFLTPLGALFALAAAVPLAAFVLGRRRETRVRRAFSLGPPPRRLLVPAVGSLVLLPLLLGVAAAQPVVVRQQQQLQRADAQVFVVFDTSLSMAARRNLRSPTRLGRAKQEALRLVRHLGDIPVGVATMTDRVLPNLLPTTDIGLLDRTIRQTVGVDRPPPSRLYRDRATSLAALLPLGDESLYGSGVRHRILVVYTDGEAGAPPPAYAIAAQPDAVVPPFFVHVWAPGERVFAHGRPDPRYREDATSAASLARYANLTHGRVFAEGDGGALAGAIRAAAGPATAARTVQHYSRVALAPWFVLGGIVPLGFLLYRRNL